MPTLLEQMRQKKGNSKRAIMRSLKPQILAALADYSKHQVYETLVANGQFDGHYTTFCRYVWKWEVNSSQVEQQSDSGVDGRAKEPQTNLTTSREPETTNDDSAIPVFQLRTYDKKDLI